MSDNKQAENKAEETDKELSELLDSALADFTKDGGKKVEKAEGEAKEAAAEQPPEQKWTEDFIKQAAEQFESNIAAILGNSGEETGQISVEQIQASFKKMAEAAQEALVNPGISDPVPSDLASTITQTIQGLNQGSENLQSSFSEQDIISMFTGAAGGEGDQNGFLPFMQGMMQSLLSKEVLYPSLKDILEKYPGWLQENESKITPEEKEKYMKQQELMQEVCNQLETEMESDSAEIRKERFDKVLELMQKLQDYGQPPSEIVADVEPALPFDQAPNLDQCSLM